MLNRSLSLFLILFLFEIFIVFPAFSLNDFESLYDSARKHKSVSMAELALKTALESGDDQLVAKAYFLIAFYQTEKFMYYEGLDNYFLALEHYRKVKDFSKQIRVLQNIGIIYTKGGYFRKAIDFYQDGITLAQRSNDIEKELVLSYQIARAYQLNGSYLEAKDAYIDLVPKFKELNDEIMVSRCYMSLGYIEAMEGRNYDSADYFYTNAIVSRSKSQDLARLTRMYSLAYMKIQAGSYNEAKALLLTALDQSPGNLNNKKLLRDIYSNLGKVYSETGNKDSAALIYEKAIALGHIKEFDQNYLQKAKYLYDFYKNFNTQKSNEYNDIIFQFANELSEFKQNLQEASHRYQITAANYKRETELIYAQQRDRMILNAILYISLGLIMLTGLIYYLYERRKRVTKWRKVLNELTIKPGITSYP